MRDEYQSLILAIQHSIDHCSRQWVETQQSLYWHEYLRLIQELTAIKLMIKDYESRL